jgi:small subunit ribosomal protein S6
MRSVPTVSYEAMFLFPQSALADLKGAVEHIRENLTRQGATIVALKKWSDRPLAYPINKQKRGLYILCYFQVPTDRLAGIERAFNLSEQVMRFMIVRCDHLSIEEMQSAEGQADLLVEANLRAASQPTAAPAAPAAPATAEV